MDAAVDPIPSPGKSEPHWSAEAAAAIAAAQRLAGEQGRPTAGTEHLLAALIESDASSGARLLAAVGVDVAALRVAVKPSLARVGTPLAAPARFTLEAEEVLAHAAEEAGEGRLAGVRELLVALCRCDGVAREVLAARGVRPEALPAAGEPAESSAAPPWSRDAERAWQMALAEEAGSPEEASLHLLRALLRLGWRSSARRALAARGVSVRRLGQRVAQELAALPRFPSPAGPPSAAWAPLRDRASRIARSLHAPTLRSIHLLIALAEGSDRAAVLLHQSGVAPGELITVRLGGPSPARPAPGAADARRLSERLTLRAARAIYRAQQQARQAPRGELTPEHLLAAILADETCVACRALGRLGVDPASLRGAIPLPSPHPPAREARLAERTRALLELAYLEARALRSEVIGTEHLLLGIVREGQTVAAHLLAEHGVTAEEVRQAMKGIRDLTPAPAAPTMSTDTPRSPFDAVASLRSLLAAAREAENAEALVAAIRAPLIAAQPALRHLCRISDLTREGALALIVAGRLLKATRETGRAAQRQLLAGRSLAMLFEKPSLRTRVSFEIGMFELGGQAIYLQPADIKMGERETVADCARVLGRMAHGIMARTFAHATVMELAEHAGVPIINGLSDLEHPCQAIADFLTIEERFGQIAGIRFAYIGDGNNMAHSLALLGTLLGAHVTLACPPSYRPLASVLQRSEAYAAASGGSLRLVHDPCVAAEGAHVLYTDVWTSMGQEDEAEQRRRDFAGYRIDAELLGLAADEAIVMHCLPAHRGEEITADVLEGPRSLVFQQAENRLHAQKAVLLALLGR